MASVILPTTEWTDGCEDVLSGLVEDDELLVVADRESDPVVENAPPAARTVVAGDPVRCAGKANALVAGMERASQDLIVWTDDDVARDEGWRDRLVDGAREHGAATEIPVYVGRGLWRLCEPAMVVLGSLGLAYGGHVWGGGTVFDRTALDEDELLSDLRRTVGDDSLLSTYVDDPWVDHDHPGKVPVGGSLSVRFAKAAF